MEATAPPALIDSLGWALVPGVFLTLVMDAQGWFADASNFELRFVPDYQHITKIVAALKTLELPVVLTSGSFDVLHEGHSLYLEAARRLGGFLIVGVDSDDKIRQRKGPSRPAVPQAERLRMVTHQRGVGMVTLKEVSHERWALIKAVRPDILVATEETYTDAELHELERHFCGRVEVLARMATISTSARLRRMQLELASQISQRLPELIANLAWEDGPRTAKLATNVDQNS